MPLLDDIFDTSPEIQRDRKLLDSLGIHLDFIRRVPTVQDEGQEEYAEHYGEGQPCKQGETSASTGCIKQDGNSDTSKSSDGKSDSGDSKPVSKTLTPKQLAQKILELSKDPVNLLDSPEKQKKLAALTFAVAAKISRFMFASFGAQPFKDFAAAVKVVAGLKEVKRGWKALSGKGEWTKEDGQALKKALYDIPAFAIPTAANWLLPTGPLFPMLYAHPKTKGWFAKELTDPTDDPINKALKKLESYFDDMEGKLVDKAGLNYARGFGLDLTPAGIRFLTDVLRLSYVDLHRMQAGLFNSKGLQK